METYNVTFQPDGVTVEAARGKNLLEVAAAAGVAVTAVCGGDGVCGKCRVIVKSGKVTAKPNIFLGRLDIQRGVALACQTYVDGDVVVEVPLESRVGGVPQLASEDAIRYGRVSERVGEAAAFPHNSLARKEYLDLPVPEIDDNTSDQERIFEALRRKQDIPIMQMGLSVLRDVASVLRASNWQVTALLGHRGGTVEVMEVCSGDTSGRNYGVAVDLGTTTVVAHLVDLNSSETLATKAKYNSQVSFGDDVIARMMYATNGERRRQLQDALVSDVNDLIAALVSEAKVKLQDVHFVICAGNTTMTHFLYGLRPEHIRKDPYVPSMSYPPTVRAAEVGVTISARGLLAALPSVASYVGGDVIADVLVTGMTESEEVSLLIDMGTNGELVLGNSDWMVCCSASAGPAFEGGGISCGMRATNGAIEHIKFDERGRVKDAGVVGGGKPLGICGSGIIDAVGELLRTGCIDRGGRLMPDKCGSRLRESESGDKEFVLFLGKDTALGRDIVVTEADISNLIHTKGSIFMAVECLLDHVGLEFDDVKHVYIAGGFGNYLQVEQAIGIGLLPDLDPGIFQCVGNGSVQGAKMALLSLEAHEYIKDRIASCMTYLELSTYHKYMNEYSSTLFLPHTDIEKFPSLMEKAEAL